MYFRYDIFVRPSEFEKTSKKKNGEVSFSEEDVSLTKEEILLKLLRRLNEMGKIFGIYAKTVDQGTRKQISFWISRDDLELVLSDMQYHGFGVPGSETVVIINEEEVCEGFASFNMEKKPDEHLTGTVMGTIKATTGKLTVRKVLEEVRQKAMLTLDGILHLISAAVLAMIGLGTNQGSIVVASMFLAPFMDPLNLINFAIRIKDVASIKYGAKVFALYMGIIFSIGLIFGPLMNYWAYLHNVIYGDEYFQPYPTHEMTVRGYFEALCLGLVVSMVSAISTYTSITNPRNNNVLIGNAISLSLVPPLVNSGMLFSTAIVAWISATLGSDTACTQAFDACSGGNVTNIDEKMKACLQNKWMRAFLKSNSYNFERENICRIPSDFFEQGVISFFVMFINVMNLLFIGQFLLFIMKFTPDRFGPKHIHSFYKYDLDDYKNIKTIKTRDPMSTDQFIEALRHENEAKDDGLSPADFEVVLDAAKASVHYNAVGEWNVETLQAFSHDTKTQRQGLHMFAQSGRTRLLSENQRTIRDTILGHDFDSNRELRQRNRHRSGTDDGLFVDFSPSSPRRPSEAVGRFQITTA